MYVHLTEEQALLAETVQKFAAERIVPRAIAWSRESCVPKAVIDEVAELGILGLELDPDAGGAGMGLKELALVTEALGSGDAGLALGVLMHGVAGWAHALGGVDVEAMATGEVLGSVGWGRAETLVATSSGEATWTLTGQVAGVTWVNSANRFVVLATVDEGNQALFSVERGGSGLMLEASPEELGFRSANLGSLTLENTSATLLSGESGDIAALQGRIQLGLAAIAVGIGHEAMEVGRRYAAERKQFGKPIATFQAIQFKLADMLTEVEAGRLLLWRAADEPKTPGAAAMARLYAGEAALRAANECLQIHGGYGFTEEYSPERLYRDAQLVKILAGSSQMQRLELAKTFLENP